mgnify:CR=1 FL=1
MHIEIDPGAGFCFGVEQVIRTAESHLRSGEKIYGLGEMVHNESEMERLHELGLETITHSDLASLRPERVLIRAHGEPPSTYELTEQLKIEVIDGTCPIVLTLQKRIREVYLSMNRENQQLVIFGKSDHPETIGLVGQAEGHAVVISSVEEVGNINPAKEIILFSQTTMDPDEFSEVEKKLKEQSNLPVGTGTFRSSCTICGQMKKRKPGLAVFARQHDIILFVSGPNSSNGRMLSEYCRSVNPHTYWISGAGEINPAWFRGVSSAGISGATSTSRQQLESVASRVKKLTST